VVPGTVDLILFEQGIAAPPGTYTFFRHNPSATIGAILDGNHDLWLPLGRQYPAFRQPAVERIIHSIARENALFAVATALPDVIPSLIELPWAFGEFASDTAFLTGNQIRMAFLIAAACGRDAGFSNQKGAILSIACGAFGWRALAPAGRRLDSQGRHRLRRNLRGGERPGALLPGQSLLHARATPPGLPRSVATRPHRSGIRRQGLIAPTLFT
jgi:hypothetical protein